LLEFTIGNYLPSLSGTVRALWSLAKALDGLRKKEDAGKMLVEFAASGVGMS